MPQTYFKSGGSWVAANNIFAKVSGAWARIKTVWAKVNGQWVRAGGTVIFNINANVDQWNLRNALSAAGFNPDAAPWQVEITVAGGVTVYSSNAGVPAMELGALPAGAAVTLRNHGTIVGCGGAQNSGGGGTAIRASVYTSIHNHGVIAGGGGGGGAGGTSYWTDRYGSSENGYTCTTRYYSYGGAGGFGAGVNGATGGAGPSVTTGNAIGGYGGSGGGWGAPGGSGTTGTARGNSCGYSAAPGSPGGAGGLFAAGNGNISWAVAGDRRGGVA